jgi:hypothetical protein
MEKIDARKHSPETQYEIRKQVVRLRKQGVLNNDVAEGVGVSDGRASKIWQSYKKESRKTIKLADVDAAWERSAPLPPNRSGR